MTNGIDTILQTPRKGLQDSLSGTAPHVSTICLPDITTHDQISQAHSCTWQVIKD